MFIENHRLENMIGGQALSAVPYPEISAEDWKAWQAFLPVRTDYRLGDRSKPGLIRRLGMLVSTFRKSKFGASAISTKTLSRLGFWMDGGT
jgi:hypothetical protein